MKIYWYSIACVCMMLKSGVEIDNRSSYPFKITSVVHEHFNGLDKMPMIESPAQTVAAHTRSQIVSKQSQSATYITGMHRNRMYTFECPPHTDSVIVVSADNEIRLIKQKPNQTNVADSPIGERKNAIRAL